MDNEAQPVLAIEEGDDVGTDLAAGATNDNELCSGGSRTPLFSVTHGLGFARVAGARLFVADRVGIRRTEGQKIDIQQIQMAPWGGRDCSSRHNQGAPMLAESDVDNPWLSEIV